MSKIYIFAVVLVLCFVFTANSDAYVLISEILADPPSGLTGDANGDGVSSTSEDEFVELYNNSSELLDISGWSISDNIRKRHIFFDNTFLNPYSCFVVFGGGNVILPGISAQVSSTGSLGLNNSGDKVSLIDINNSIIDEITYGKEASLDQSIARHHLDIESNFILHSKIDNTDERLFSPGVPVFTDVNDNVIVPELNSLILLLAGLIFCKGHFQLLKRI